MTDTLVGAEVVKDAVRSACRAPSLHNSQPWQWVFDGGQLRLFLDPSRVMDTDQSAREALIGCGAALDHLRVAIAAAGWRGASICRGFSGDSGRARAAGMVWRGLRDHAADDDARCGGSVGGASELPPKKIIER